MKVFEVLEKIFYPDDIKCIVCDGELSEDSRYGLCNGCSLSANTQFCTTCGRAIKGIIPYCGECIETSHNYDKARAPFVFENDVRTLVHRLKYGNARYLVKYMAEFMADTYFENNFNADIITFVPMHPRKEYERGYNQAELLARSIGQLVNKPVERLLFRNKYSPNLAHMSRADRMKEANGSISAIDNNLTGKQILLVDDVFTTGITANECAVALKKKGADYVIVLTFATGRKRIELY